MRYMLMVAVFGMMVAGVVGCQHDKGSSDTMKMDSMKDDCPMCPGVQHADANGYCPKCGMKVK